MNHLHRIGLVVMLNLVALCGTAATRPHVLFILTDDQRASTVHALGNEAIRTPAMDRLVKEGTAFTRATIMGGNSGAVCMPSRAMILSGRNLFRIDNNLAAGHATLPESLRSAGYATFITGKWHNGVPAVQRMFDAGQAVFLGGMGAHVDHPVSDLEGGKLVRSRKEPGFDAETFADAAIGFLKERPADKPFFLWLSFKTPHDPRTFPEKYHQLYDPAAIELPPNFLPRHPFDNGELVIRDEQLAATPRDPAEIRRHIAGYYAGVTATDEQIGRVLQALDELGLATNTVVVFTGDNGLAVGQHGLMGKQNLYEHSIGVPLIVRGPGIAKGRQTAALCQLFDLNRTLLGLCGVDVPASVEGVDLAPVLRGERDVAREATLHDYRNFQRAVRTPDWKLVEYLVKGERRTQLFNVASDPWEMQDLAADPAQAERVAALRVRLQALERETGAPVLAAPGGQKGGKAGKAHE